MSKVTVNWLAAIMIILISFASFAEESKGKSTDKYIGKWDTHAGIISFYLQNTTAGKQVRVLSVDENSETKIALNLLGAELDDFEELVENTLYELGKTSTLPVTSSNAKESNTPVGNLIYPNGNIKLLIVSPSGTQSYASMRITGINKKLENVYWLEKEDLIYLKKLLDKALKAIG